MLDDCFAVLQLPSMSSYFMLSYRLCIYLLLSPSGGLVAAVYFQGQVSPSVRPPVTSFPCVTSAATSTAWKQLKRGRHLYTSSPQPLPLIFFPSSLDQRES